MLVRFERSLWLMLLVVGCIGGYLVIGHSVDGASTRSLHTDWDARIPFAPWTVVLYLWVFTIMVYPCFVIRCTRLFRRTVLAFSIVIVASLLTFATFPVSAAALRADRAVLDPTVWTHWVVLMEYSLDPPVNCFPSLHISIAALSALSAWKARKLYGVFAFVVLVLITISVTTIKQHFLADVGSALVLAGAAYGLVLHPYDSDSVPLAERAMPWSGPAQYAVFHCAFYVFAFVLFTLGVKAW